MNRTQLDARERPSPRRRGEYGVDGSYDVVSAGGVAAIHVAVGAALTGFLVRSLRKRSVPGAVASGAALLRLAGFAGTFLYTTRVGKFEVWSRILGELGLRGDERVLDLGCGRGAILLMAAELVPHGRAVGIDLWHADQTGNSPDATRRNAELEGVADRVDVHTGDITRLPFDDDSFDVVTSNVVIHNLPTAADRDAAIDEAVRVLRPGGRLVLADPLYTDVYCRRLRSLGVADVRRRALGWRMWWGTPLLATRLVTGTKGRP